MSARPVSPVPVKPLKILGWILVASTAASLIAAHAGVPGAARLAAILATAALTAAFAGRVGGRHRVPLRILTLLAGASLVGALLLGHLQSLPQLLLPVMIPLLLGWTFGRTLRPGRTPLIDLVARAVHDVPHFEPRMTRYTRRITVLWTGIFAALVLGNAFLLCNATPGGLFEIVGLAPLWPVPLATCARLSGLVMGALLPTVFVVEYLVRLSLFPDYRFPNPLALARAVARRWPAIDASLRNE